MSDNSILILANGEWGNPARAHRLAGKADCVIAADGAWAKAVTAGIHVDCVVGDLDSLTSDEKAALLDSGIDVQIHPPEKDYTDLELAVASALSRSPRRLAIFGALGGRLDHMLANILLLETAASRGAQVMLIAGQETAWIVDESLALADVAAGDRISLISLSDEAIVRTSGLKYPLNDEPLFRASARGVSNEVVDPPVRIAVRSGLLLAVHGEDHAHQEARS